MRRLLESPPSRASTSTSSTLSFVMISDPSEGMNEEVRRQVRSHAANSWRGISRLRTLRRVGLRPLEPKSHDLGVSQQALESSQISPQAEDKDYHPPHPDQSTSTQYFASSTVTFTQCTPSPGPSPVTYLGGGRIDPFDSCAVRCNTMESFLLDHCKCWVFSIYMVRSDVQVDLKDQCRYTLFYPNLHSDS